MGDMHYRAANDELAKRMTGEKRLFLDVRQSVSGVSWEHRLTERQDLIALAIAQGHGVPDIVARVLAGRGVTAE
ncbi:single-stranded-DNA-specific exonuclease RecJ, partial [Mesorhizobium sp. M7A.T.Ca.TU.009.01.1.2]